MKRRHCPRGRRRRRRRKAWRSHRVLLGAACGDCRHAARSGSPLRPPGAHDVSKSPALRCIATPRGRARRGAFSGNGVLRRLCGRCRARRGRRAVRSALRCAGDAWLRCLTGRRRPRRGAPSARCAGCGHRCRRRRLNVVQARASPTASGSSRSIGRASLDAGPPPWCDRYRDAEDAVETIRSLTDGRGADYVFDTVGTPRRYERRCSNAQRGTWSSPGCREWTRLKRRPVSIRHAGKATGRLGLRVGRPPEDIARLVEWYGTGRLKLQELIGRRYRLDQ